MEEGQKIILVDHNEMSQAVDGLDKADLVEIIDHHRLGGIVTSNPLFVRMQPVGCTATILYNVAVENNLTLPKEIAGLLFSAISSDTLYFKSPTTTEKDKDEAFLDALLTPAPNKEEAQTQNPTQGPAAKSRPSEPTSNQREKTVRGISDPTERSRPSVRQEMKELREEQRQRTSSAQKSKEEPNRTTAHRPVPNKKKDKER